MGVSLNIFDYIREAEEVGPVIVGEVEVDPVIVVLVIVVPVEEVEVVPVIVIGVVPVEDVVLAVIGVVPGVIQLHGLWHRFDSLHSLMSRLYVFVNIFFHLC